MRTGKRLANTPFVDGTPLVQELYGVHVFLKSGFSCSAEFFKLLG
jgi:hypothetical protein